VFQALLDNPRLTAAALLPALADERMPPQILDLVAKSPRWGPRYAVCRSLCRNPQSPFRVVFAALPRLRREHLAEVAEIGGTDEVYSPTTKAALVSELQEIIGEAVTCQLDVSAGRIQQHLACKGEVLLNGEPLECEGDDGWELVDDKHILLKGKACDDYKLSTTAVLSASFPCEAVQ
jgi:hypothetical protein